MKYFKTFCFKIDKCLLVTYKIGEKTLGYV